MAALHAVLAQQQNAVMISQCRRCIGRGQFCFIYGPVGKLLLETIRGGLSASHINFVCRFSRVATVSVQ